MIGYVVATSTAGAVKLTVVRLRVVSSTPGGALQVHSSSGPSASSLSRPVRSTSAPSRTVFDAPLFITSGRATGGERTLESTSLPPEPLLQPCNASHAAQNTMDPASEKRGRVVVLFIGRARLAVQNS